MFRKNFILKTLSAGAFIFVFSVFFTSQTVLAVDDVQLPPVVTLTYCCCRIEINTTGVDENVCREEEGIEGNPDRCAQFREPDNGAQFTVARLPESGNCADAGVLPQIQKTPPTAPAKTDEPNGAAELQAIKDRAESVLNPMGFKEGKTGISDLIGRVIGALLGIAGTIALVLYIYAGAMWMLAGGDPGRVGTAKKILIWTTLGVVVMLGSYIIVKEIFGLLK